MLRCECPSSETEEVEGLPNCLRCKTCGGWFALRIGCMSDLALLEAAFPPKVAAPVATNVASNAPTEAEIMDGLGLVL
jgi:hypothetical protein